MKRLFILSGGTAAAWYLTNSAKKWFPGKFEVIIGDIYKKEFVPASTIADEFVQLPYINSTNYYKTMIQLLADMRVDFLVPIIDDDLFFFPSDNIDLLSLGIKSTAPPINTVINLSDKRNLSHALNKIGVLTPKLVERIEEIDASTTYFCKPVKGHGSIGGERRYGKDFQYNYNFTENIVQEACNSYVPELTVDIFCNNDQLFTCARNRISVKAGLCVKASLYNEEDLCNITNSIERISHSFQLPLGSCVQFMKDYQDRWNLIDFNLRIGGGTALSDAAGFQIGRAMMASLLCEELSDDWFDIDYSIKSVVRVYKEIVMR